MVERTPDPKHTIKGNGRFW